MYLQYFDQRILVVIHCHNDFTNIRTISYIQRHTYRQTKLNNTLCVGEWF